jgi:hypothetical protein
MLVVSGWVVPKQRTKLVFVTAQYKLGLTYLLYCCRAGTTHSPTMAIIFIIKKSRKFSSVY